MAPTPMMSLLLPILLFAAFSYATVLNNTTVHELVPSSSCPTRRSLWKIITSCATTLFASAWTAIHPNMPGPTESSVTVGFRRLGTMFLALVAPEAVLMWATRQLFAAITTRKQFQEALHDGTIELRVKPCQEPRLVSAKAPYDADEVRIPIPEDVPESWSEKLSLLYSSISATFRRPSSHVHEKLDPSSVTTVSLKGYCRWTLKHSFYAWMGGFMLFVDRNSDLPREVYHPLTPDELLEYLKADRVQMAMVSESDLDDRSKGDWLSKTVSIMQLVWFAIQLIARSYRQLSTTQVEIASLGISVLGCFTYAFWWYKPKAVRCSVPVYWKQPGELPPITYSVPFSIDDFLLQFGVKRNWIRDHFGFIYRPLLNLEGFYCISDSTVKAHRVPTLCGYPPETDKGTFGRNFPVVVIGSLTGMVFGGIHCIAWNFTFPTYAEQTLWRISSVGITILPALAAFSVVCEYLVANTGTTQIPHPNAIIYGVGTIYAIYGGSRLVLLVLMATTLRALPVGVYDEVCWTSLIPHWY